MKTVFVLVLVVAAWAVIDCSYIRGNSHLAHARKQVGGDPADPQPEPDDGDDGDDGKDWPWNWFMFAEVFSRCELLLSMEGSGEEPSELDVVIGTVCHQLKEPAIAALEISKKHDLLSDMIECVIERFARDMQCFSLTMEIASHVRYLKDESMFLSEVQGLSDICEKEMPDQEEEKDLEVMDKALKKLEEVQVADDEQGRDLKALLRDLTAALQKTRR